jgi:flavin reductase (DIM6/NTAB) family NADH-FMN oxidoreductase RutF
MNVYKLLTGAVVPRPIAFVSTISADGVFNLAPFSFFNAFSANPPVVGFSPSHSADGRSKDTLANIKAVGEFVVNIVSEEIAEQMNATSAPFPPEVDEFEATGLTPAASDMVRPPRVKESRVSMECKLLQIVELSRLPMGGNLVLGEVVRFHVDDDIVDDYRIDPGKLRAVGRMAGPTYVRTRDRFDMARPTAAPVNTDAKGIAK